MFFQPQLNMHKPSEHNLQNPSQDTTILSKKVVEMPEKGNHHDGNQPEEWNHIEREEKLRVSNGSLGKSGSSEVQRYLPAGWCALLCKIKHQRIVKWDTINSESESKIESSIQEGMNEMNIRNARSNSLCSNIMMLTPKASFANHWKPYLRPILPPSRPNLWRRTEEFLVERNQLP